MAKKKNKLAGKFRFDVVPVSIVIPDPDQPRDYFDPVKIEELKLSIDEMGLLEEIKVRHEKGRGYHIIDGERRYRAIKLLGWEKVPVKIMEISKRDVYPTSVVANFAREEMTEIEVARSFHQLMEVYDLTVEDIARRVAKSVTWVRNMLKYLRLDEDLQIKMVNREITPVMGLAIANYPKKGQKKIHHEVERRAGDKTMTTQEANRLVAKVAEDKGVERLKPKRGKKALPSHVLVVNEVSSKAQKMNNVLVEFLDYDPKTLETTPGANLQAALSHLQELQKKLKEAMNQMSRIY